jgi:hypothetical protein
VNVQYASAPMIQNGGRHDAHEAGTTDEFYAVRSKRVVKCSVKGFSRRILLVVNNFRRDIRGLGEVQSRRSEPVGDDARDFGGIIRVACRLYEGTHVGAAARNQDGGALLRHQASWPR